MAKKPPKPDWMRPFLRTTGGRGRPGWDWEALEKAWRTSGQTKEGFLAQFGIDAGSGAAYLGTKDWKREVVEIEAVALPVGTISPPDEATPTTILEAELGPTEEPVQDGAEPRLETSRDPGPGGLPPPSPASAPGGDPSPGVAPPQTARGVPGDWTVIKEWRARQAIDDWKTADQVRMHVKMLLKNSIREDLDARGKKTYVSTLTAHQARQLTQALEGVQRIQRLSLGLSTENVGIDPAGGAPDTNVEKNVTPTEEPIPTFVVEMSKRGKFVRPRPRRVS